MRLRTLLSGAALVCLFSAALVSPAGAYGPSRHPRPQPFSVCWVSVPHVMVCLDIQIVLVVKVPPLPPPLTTTTGAPVTVPPVTVPPVTTTSVPPTSTSTTTVPLPVVTVPFATVPTGCSCQATGSNSACICEQHTSTVVTGP